MDTRTAVKAKVVNDIAQRAELQPEAVNEMVRQWAESSNDNDMRSLSLQEAAAEELGLELSPYQKTKIGAMRTDQANFITYETRRLPGRTEEQAWATMANERPDLLPLQPRSIERRFVRAMYGNTQDKLSEMGFSPDDHVTLFRGLNLAKAEVPDGWADSARVQIKGNATESWSFDLGVGSDFAEGGARSDVGIVLAMDVPVKNVIGTCVSGWGCLPEAEIVVAGVPSEALIYSID